VIIGANTPPVASCTESVNPSGRNTPPAGSTTLPGSKGGKNEDGFYELVGEDNEDGTAPVFVTNASGSATFGPFSSGSVVKITEAPGRTPTAKSMGGPSSAVAAHITLDSDAFVFAVDSGGEESPVVSCLPDSRRPGFGWGVPIGARFGRLPGRHQQRLLESPGVRVLSLRDVLPARHGLLDPGIRQLELRVAEATPDQVWILAAHEPAISAVGEWVVTGVNYCCRSTQTILAGLGFPLFSCSI
jgi:hypothetical protein